MTDKENSATPAKWGSNEDKYHDLSPISRAVVHSFYLESLTLSHSDLERLRRLDNAEIFYDVAIDEILESIKSRGALDCDPRPKNDVLQNRFAITDASLLQRVETSLASCRLHQLERQPTQGRFDLQHLQTIHKHIFQDIYPWAGEIRIVDIAKGNTMFARSAFIVGAAEKLFKALASEFHLKDLTGAAFARRAAHYLAEINALHPFREGNGRTQRAFMAQLARENRYNLDFTHITRAEMVEASIQSSKTDPYAFERLLSRALGSRD